LPASLVGFDRHLERLVVEHRSGVLNPLFEALSWVGTAGAVWLGIALAAAVLLRRPSLFVMVVAADALADGAALGLKQAIGRQRPPLRYPQPRPLVHVPHDGSFPSGHAATSFACATILTFALPRFSPLFLLLALAVAFSRVYVGVHYPLDVLGGAALGVAVATALRLLATARRRSPRAQRSG
jgi:undecaprenyl-diphosphatase